MTDRPPAPAGLHLVVDPSLVRRDDGRVLVGGSPFRLMRLSDAGARVVRRWLDGSPVRDGAEAALLRILDVDPDFRNGEAQRQLENTRAARERGL